MAAGAAAECGGGVLLIERNEKAGKKLYITGKGRCNVTNADPDLESFLENVVRNPKFLNSALRRFTNFDLIDFFENHGVALKVERGDRVFPKSDKASDIIRALERYIQKCGAQMRCDTRVKDMIVKDDKAAGILTTHGEEIYSRSVVLATGGASYQITGSTGDGYKIAEKLGHRIIPPEPSLVPIEVHEKWARALSGLSLKNVRLSALSGDKVVAFEFGEMLFTHFGISGPIVLSLSSYIKPFVKESKNIKLCLDLKPALSPETLDKRICRDFEGVSRKLFKNSLDKLLPSSLIPVIVELCGIDGDKPVNQITKDERAGLVRTLKNLPLSVKGLRPLDEAIVTSGGIDTKEINPSTMESKLIKGLYFAGEIIDIDALTGGYNLQIAFSTGRLAGISAAGGKNIR